MTALQFLTDLLIIMGGCSVFVILFIFFYILKDILSHVPRWTSQATMAYRLNKKYSHVSGVHTWWIVIFYHVAILNRKQIESIYGYWYATNNWAIYESPKDNTQR